jgi:hypothetical protein
MEGIEAGGKTTGPTVTDSRCQQVRRGDGPPLKDNSGPIQAFVG